MKCICHRHRFTNSHTMTWKSAAFVSHLMCIFMTSLSLIGNASGFSALLFPEITCQSNTVGGTVISFSSDCLLSLCRWSSFLFCSATLVTAAPANQFFLSVQSKLLLLLLENVKCMTSHATKEFILEEFLEEQISLLKLIKKKNSISLKMSWIVSLKTKMFTTKMNMKGYLIVFKCVKCVCFCV